MKRLLVTLLALAPLLAPDLAWAESGSVALLPYAGGDYDRFLPDGTGNYAARMDVAKDFFSAHADAYDFIVVFTDFAFDFGEPMVRGLFSATANTVAGTGIPLFDNDALYGSAGRLQGIVDMGPAPTEIGTGPSTLGEKLNILAHEIGHRFLAHARYRDASGETRADLLGRDDAHWSFFLNTDASVMYGNAWRDNGNGTFTSVEARKRYSWLDLYLMGLATPAEVPDVVLIDPAPSVPYAATDLPAPSVTIAGSSRAIPLAELIAAMGPRLPPSSASQRTFRAAFVYLYGRAVPDPQAVANIDTIRRAFVNEFFFLTHGRGLVDTDLLESPPPNLSGSPGTAAGLSYLLDRQEADGLWRDDPRRELIDSAAALDALAAVGGAAAAQQAGLASLLAALAAKSPSDTDMQARAVALTTLLTHGAAGATLTESLVDSARASAGFGIGGGYERETTSTALASRALKLAAANDAAAGPTLAIHEAALRSLQNADGGFASIAGGESRAQPTAVAILALIEAFEAPAGDLAVSAAEQFLAREHFADGSFGDEVGDAFCTAWAARALLAAQWPDTSLTQGAINYLLSTQQANGSWDDLLAPTAQALLLLRQAWNPNLKLLSLSSSARSPSEGTVVRITARVTNAGAVASTATTVRFATADGSFVAELPLGPLPSGTVTTVTLDFDTEGHPGRQELYAFIDPQDVVSESSEIDNQGLVVLQVSPRPSPPDLRLPPEAVSVSPSVVSVLPSVVSVQATVQNVGRQASGPTVVSIREDDTLVTTVPIDVPGASSAVVAFAVPVLTGGGHTIEITVDPDDLVSEADETNNEIAVPLAVAGTVDFALARLSASPSAVEIGETVDFVAQAANHGTLTTSTTIDFSVVTAASTRRVAAKVVTLPGGATADVHVSWKSDVAGEPLALRAVIDPNHVTSELDESNNSVTGTVAVRPSSKPNLNVTAADIRVTPDVPLAGQETKIRVVVRNTGVVDARGAVLRLGLGANPGLEIARRDLGTLSAGQEVAVEVAWVATSHGKVTLFATLDPDDALAEFDETDNQAFLLLDVAGLPDLVVDAGDFTFAPAAPRQGDSVQVAVRVRNTGGQPSAPTTLRLSQTQEGGTPVVLGTVSVPAVAASGSRDVALLWNTTGLAGAFTLQAAVDPDNVVAESDEANNTATRAIALQNADLFVDFPVFSPNGDGVRDSVTITYRLAVEAPQDIKVSDTAGHLWAVLRQGAPPSGSVTWDGRGDDGVLVPDGDYTATLSATAGTDSRAVAIAVDTNETSIIESLRRKNTYAIDLALLDDLYGYGAPAFAAGSRALLYESRGGVLREVEWEHLDLVSEQRAPLSDLGYARSVAVSPVDGKIAFYHPGDASVGIGADGLYVLDPVSAQRRLLAADDWTSLSFTPSQDVPPRWSADGTHLLAWASLGGRPPVVVDLAAPTGAATIAAPRPGPFASYRVASFDVAADGFSVVWQGRDAPNPLIFEDLRFSDDIELPVSPVAYRISPDGRMVAVVQPPVLDAVEPICSYDLAVLDLPFGSPVVVGNRRVRAQGTIRDCSEVHCEPCDPMRCPHDASIAWSHDNKTMLLSMVARDHSDYDCQLSHSDDGLYRASADGDALVDLTPALPAGMSPWSPSLAPDDAAALAQDSQVLASYDNLTARLKLARAPGGGSVAIIATADDLHFDSFDVEAQSLATTRVWPIATGRRMAVRNALLATWTPPAAGSYVFRIVARDLGGNVRVQERKLAFTSAPLVSALRVEPALFSPNGDGTLDVTTFSYHVAEPANLLLVVVDGLGETVRTWAPSYALAGDYSLVWDGLDDSGALVPDGHYAVRVDGNEAYVEVDATPPAIEASSVGPVLIAHTYSSGVPGFLGGGESSFFELAKIYTWRQSRSDSTYLYPGYVFGSQGPAAPDTTVVLESRRRGSSDDFTPLGSSQPTELAGTSWYVSMEQARSYEYRLVARDLVGNVSVHEMGAPDERLLAWRAAQPLAALPEGLAYLPQVWVQQDTYSGRLLGGAVEGSTLLVKNGETSLVAADPIHLRADAPEVFMVDWSSVAWPVSATIEAVNRTESEPRITIEPLDFDTVSGEVTFATDLLTPGSRYSLTVVAAMAGGQELRSNPVVAEAPRLEMSSLACLSRAEDGRKAVFAIPHLPIAGSLVPAAARFIDASGRAFAARPGAFIDCRTHPELCQGPDAPEPDALIEVGLDGRPSCKAKIEVDLATPSGELLTVAMRSAANLCGIAVPEDISVYESHVRLGVHETFGSGPVGGAQVIFRGPQGEAAYALPVFEKQLSGLDVDLIGELGLCGPLSLWARSDGNVQPIEAPWCDYPYISVPCASVALEARARGPETCGSQASDYAMLALVNGEVSDFSWRLEGPSGVVVDLPAQADVAGHVEASVPARDLGEGQWLLIAEAYDMLGQALSQEMPFAVDKGFPEVAIDYPYQAALVCPERHAAPGGTVLVAPVSGHVADEGGLRYRAGIAPLDFVGSQVEAFSGTVSGEPADIRGVLGRWDINPARSGDYALTLMAADAGKNVACTSVTFTLDADVRMAVADAAPGLFSPNGDGEIDETTMHVDVAEPVRLSASVMSDEVAIAKLAQDESIVTGSYDVVWDGRTRQGTVAPDGVYTVEVKAQDSCGNTASRSQSVEVDITAPVVEILEPAAGAVVTGTVTIRGTADDKNFDEYVLSAEPAGGAATRIAKHAYVIKGDTLGTWDTAGLAAGPYRLRLSATDRARNTAIREVALTVGSPTLIEKLVATPRYFSPNGDGIADTTEIQLALAQDCNLSVTVRDDVLGMPRVTLTSGPMAAGEHELSFVGHDDFDRLLADGRYTVFVRADNGIVVDSQQAGVVIDTASPTIGVERPSRGGYLGEPARIVGSVDDAVPLTASVDVGRTGSFARLADLRGSHTGTLAYLEGLVDGLYDLRIVAEDAAGNRSELQLPFTIDATAPQVAITAPLAGALFGQQASPVQIRGQVSDLALSGWTIGEGASTLASGNEGTAPQASWPLSGLADGEHTLWLEAVDLAGNRGRAEAQVEIDLTPPDVSLSMPAAGAYVTAPSDVVGNATDTRFAWYRLELRSISAPALTTLASSTSAVSRSRLGRLEPLAPDGEYVMRLTAADQAGNQASTEARFTVDTLPPAPPTDVVATAVGNAVTVSWTASASTDVAGYLVFRVDARKLALQVTPSAVAALAFADTNVPDGRYRYRVLAVDKAGLQSLPAESALLAIDREPPMARIVSPRRDRPVGGKLEVVATASSPQNDLTEWRLELGAGTAACAVVRASAQPIMAQPIYTLDTTVYPEGTRLTLRLVATDTAGNEAQDEVGTTVDNTPPAPVTLISATVVRQDSTGPLNTVALQWAASPSSDTAGYLFTRNADVLGEPGLKIGAAALLPGLTYANGPLGDGSYDYAIVAVDGAGNSSPESNHLTAVVETHAPAAYISSPDNDAIVSAPVTVVAKIAGADQDVARVQFQISPRSPVSFTNLGAAVTVSPYEAVLDPGTRVAGEYNLRAVATDTSSHTDASPSTTLIRVDRAPPAPGPLQAKVTSESVALSWSAAASPPPGGYRVRRDGTIIGDKATATTLADMSVAEGAHRYEVTSLSQYGIESAAQSQSALVYRPILSAPEFSQGHVDISGSGVPAGATIVLSEDAAVLANAAADTQGHFRFALDLTTGEHRLVGVATDAQGNVSKPATAVTAVAKLTIALQAGGVDGRRVSLSWTAAGADLSLAGAYALSVTDYAHETVSKAVAVDATSAIDVPATPGHYEYELTAAVASGAVLARSNRVAVDIAPEIVGPVRGGVHMKVSGGHVRAAGFGQPGATIDLTRNQRHLPSTTAAPAASSVALSETGWGMQLELFAGGELLAITYYDDTLGDYFLHVVEAATGAPIAEVPFVDGFVTDTRQQTLAFAEHDPVLGLSHLSLFDAASRAVVALTDPSSSRDEVPIGWTNEDREILAAVRGASGPKRLLAIRRTDGGERVVVDGSDGARSMVSSADGTVVAYVAVSSGQEKLVVVEVASGAVLARPDRGSTRAFSWAWPYRPFAYDSRFLAYLKGQTLNLYDVQAGHLTTVNDGVPSVLWAPMSHKLAYQRDTSGAGDIYEYDADRDQHERMTWSPDAPKSLNSYSPDGGSIVYAEEEGLFVVDIGERQPEPMDFPGKGPRSYIGSWGPDGRMVVQIEDPSAPRFVLVTPKGLFATPVELDYGENDLVATSPGAPPSLAAVVERGGSKPDLTLGDIVVTPAMPQEGSVALVTVPLLSSGPVDAGSVEVALSVVDPSGSSLWFSQPASAAGGEVQLVWPVSSVAGRHHLRVLVDIGNAVEEADETNNAAEREVEVGVLGAVSLTLATDRDRYEPGETMAMAATMTSAGWSQPVVLDVMLVDAGGALAAAVVDGEAYALPADTVVESRAQYRVPALVAGAYRLRGTVRDPVSNAALATAETAVGVTAVRSVTLSLRSDRYAYAPSDTARFEAEVVNTSPNAPIAGAQLGLWVRAQDGTTVASFGYAVPSLDVGAVYGVSAALSLASLPAGTYVMEARLATGSAEWAHSEQWFVVRAGSGGLAGQLILDTTVLPANAGIAGEARFVIRGGDGAPAPAEAGVDLLDANGNVVAEQSLGPFSVAGGSATVVPFVLAPDGLSPGRYVVMLYGALSGGALSYLDTRAVRVREGTAPAVAFVNVADGQCYGATVAPLVESVDEESGVALVEIAADGGPWTPLGLQSGGELWGEYGTELSLADGPHVLVARAFDNEGNGPDTAIDDGNPVAVGIVVDSVAPVVSIGGVSDGMSYDTYVYPSISFADPNLAATRTELNGQAFVSGSEVHDGQYVLLARATDKAGNATQQIVRFTVMTDHEPPVIAVSGVGDGIIVNSSVVPVVSVTDAKSAFTSTMTLNGVPFISGSVVMAEGDYVLHVEAVDAYANVATPVEVHWAIDKTPPAITISGVTNGTFVGASVTPVVVVTDSNLASQQLLVNGAAFASGTVLSAEGNYTLSVSALDKAGNTASKTVSWAIDKTAPAITISGVADGTFVKTSVTPVVNVTEANLASQQLLLNGAAFTSGTVVSAEGSYTLSASATDKAGNTASKTVSWVIDKTPPVIAVTGVVDGESTTSAVTPVIVVTEAHPGTASATLNGATFTTGTTVSAVGLYTLQVTATDAALNTSAVTVKFEILASGPPSPSFQFAVCSFGDVRLMNAAQVASVNPVSGARTPYGHIGAHGSIELANTASVAGSIVVGGDLRMFNSARISGDAFVAGAVRLYDTARVAGKLTKVAPPPQPCECGYDIDEALALAAAHNDNAVLTGDRTLQRFVVSGGIDVSGANVMTVPAGTYYLTHITVANDGQVKLKAGAKVRFFVAGSVVVANNAVFNGSPAGGAELLVVSGASAARGEAVTFANQAESALNVLAPAARIELSNQAGVKGSLVGGEIRVNNNASVRRKTADAAGPALQCVVEVTP